jgi:hypothetical protein
VQADVDSGLGYVGGGGALIEGQTGIGVAQQSDRETANLEFMAQQAGKSQSDIFLGQRIGQGRAALVATVRGIDYGQHAMGVTIVAAIVIGRTVCRWCRRRRILRSRGCSSSTDLLSERRAGPASAIAAIVIVLRSLLKVASSGSVRSHV